MFEINRNFRNEGVSTQHNPEFTMLEFYQAYADYSDLMDLTETLLRRLTAEVQGSQSIEYGGEIIRFEEPFKRVSVTEAVLERNPRLSSDRQSSTIGRVRPFAEDRTPGALGRRKMADGDIRKNR